MPVYFQARGGGNWLVALPFRMGVVGRWQHDRVGRICTWPQGSLPRGKPRHGFACASSLAFEGPAPAAARRCCCYYYVLCVGRRNVSSPFFFFWCIFFFLFSLLLPVVVVVVAAAAAAPIIVNPNSVLWPPVSSPFFFILRFQQNAPTHGPGLAWRLRMMLPHLLPSSHVSCLLSRLLTPLTRAAPGKYCCLGQTSWSRPR